MPLPRGLVALALLWTVAAFAATVGFRAPIQPTSGAYTPAVRSLLALLALGACVVWPVGRLTLSSRSERWTPGRALLDTVSMLVLFHAVYWPLHLVTHWSLARAASIDLLISGWIACAGGAVALGMARDARRSAWAIGCIAVAAAGAALDAAGTGGATTFAAGPFVALLALATASPDLTQPTDWAIAAWPWAPGLLLWGLALLPRARGGQPCPGRGVPVP
jgi:hypothetical protein